MLQSSSTIMPMSPSSLLNAQTGGGTSSETKTLTDMFIESWTADRLDAML